jgi:hypothetical protein
MMRTFALVLAVCGCSAATASASQSVSMSAVFAPERLGSATTVTLGFQIWTDDGQAPSPLTGVDFHYPSDLGIATSELGVASCPIASVESDGPSICPPDSVMGSGSALVAIPVGGGVQAETASLALLAGPSQEGYVRLLIAATGKSPVIARVVMSSLLLDGALKLTVPLIESLPGAPDVSFVRLHVTLGGNLTYYERRRGKTIAYKPKGVVLPERCPRGGFGFSASFTFEDGTLARAHKTLACPRASPPAGARRADS